MNRTDNTNHSQKSIVDCVYEIDDLGEFLRTHLVVCPIYYISGSICNEIPKESEKYKEIKKYIDSKLDMKRGCTYSAIIKIVWAAIYNAYKNMYWDELSLKFKKPLKRATIILNIDDSIKENIECFKKQVIAYFDAHDDSIPVSQRKFTMNYIWNNIDECESLDEIKTLAGSFFTVQFVAQDIIPAKKKEVAMEDFDVEIYLRSEKMARIKYRKGKEFWIEQYEDFPFCFSPQEPLIEDVRKFFYGRVPTGIIVPEDELVAYMKKSGGRLFMDRIKLKFRKVRETKEEKL